MLSAEDELSGGLEFMPGDDVDMLVKNRNLSGVLGDVSFGESELSWRRDHCGPMWSLSD